VKAALVLVVGLDGLVLMLESGAVASKVTLLSMGVEAPFGFDAGQLLRSPGMLASTVPGRSCR
jgi:hypothetical protein